MSRCASVITAHPRGSLSICLKRNNFLVGCDFKTNLEICVERSKTTCCLYRHFTSERWFLILFFPLLGNLPERVLNIEKFVARTFNNVALQLIRVFRSIQCTKSIDLQFRQVLENFRCLPLGWAFCFIVVFVCWSPLYKLPWPNANNTCAIVLIQGLILKISSNISKYEEQFVRKR